jgi:hypothetical protein
MEIITNLRSVDLIIVDFDGTFIHNDTTIVMFFSLLRYKPLSALLSLVSLFRGRPSFKQHLWNFCRNEISLPLKRHDSLVRALYLLKACGKRIILISGSPQELIDHYMLDYGLFDEVYGATNGNINTGKYKLKFLSDRSVSNFAYIGNDVPDLHLWRKADVAIAVSPTIMLRVYFLLNRKSQVRVWDDFSEVL